ncbi:unnamed protein product [Tenebrio molitor]|nr:unnamed protein product [Tenebrio molitor]
MVKMIKTAAVLIVLAISQCESQDSQNDQAFCNVPGIGPVPVGQQLALSNPCVVATCGPDGSLFSKEPCGRAELNSDANCVRIPGDQSKPFPHCCPRFQCSVH